MQLPVFLKNYLCNKYCMLGITSKILETETGILFNYLFKNKEVSSGGGFSAILNSTFKY